LNHDPCQFCRNSASDLFASNGIAQAFPDSSPATEGQTLVVRRRHVASIYDLAPEEQADLWSLVAQRWGPLWSRFSVLFG
jgi:diadenosine tetraphosphate (Ap4A) HIT family hydrolase